MMTLFLVWSGCYDGVYLCTFNIQWVSPLQLSPPSPLQAIEQVHSLFEEQR